MPVVENLFLRRLPAEVRRRIEPRLMPVRLGRGDYLHGVAEPLRFVYFPTGCLLSQYVSIRPGRSSEVMLVGRHGILGLPAFLGDDRLVFEVTAAIAGPALRLEMDEFRDVVDRSPESRELVRRYTVALLIQIGQLVACRSLCQIRERVACWLLRAGDEVAGDQLRVTHDAIAQSLAVRRATVTLALEHLAARGGIGQGRGTIELRDRQLIETASCVCYREVREAYEHLLGSGAKVERG